MGQVSPNYTYYGVVPSKIYRYFLNDWNVSGGTSWTNLASGWTMGTADSNYLGGSLGLNGKLVAIKSLLVIVATDDNTNVEVRNLADNSLLSSAHLDNMQKSLVLLANGTRFKVVSDKIVSVLLLNYQQTPASTANEGPNPSTFFTDVNGLYVGKKFVLMGSEQPGASIGVSSAIGAFYTILALEKSTVTITKDDNTVSTYTIDANSYKFIALDPFRVYKIESTGNIMLQSGTVAGKGSVNTTPCFAVPSTEGGFVGTTFFSRSMKSQEWTWDPGRDYGFRISASEDASVKVYNLETKELMRDLKVKGGTGLAIQPEAYAIFVQSDKPVTLTYIHNGSIEQSPTGAGGTYGGYGNGVMFIGIQPNENTMINLPVEANIEAYFFAKEATTLTIDDVTKTINANSYVLFTERGTRTVRSDHNVILQLNFWPDEPDTQGLWFTGAAIPCIETVGIDTNAKLTPLEGFPMMYVIVGAGVAAVAVIVGLLVMRRRGGKPS
jgi:hypothetical protein